MAELVVGMAKSVVDGALTKAQAAMEEEAKLRQSAARNLVFITGEFQMMQSFLEVADGERQRNVVVKTWVRQIRDLAYDVEDCIDFVVHLDKRDRWWLRLLNSWSWLRCGLPPLQLDEAVAELERLKARVEDVSTRNARYSLISDSGSKPAPAAEQSASVTDSTDAASTAFDRLIAAAGTQKASLTSLLAGDKHITGGGGDLQVISVWGSGGGDLGITSTVWNAYIDRETCRSFPCRAWVKLRRPFNPHEFVRSLTAQFFASTSSSQQPPPPEASETTIVALDVLKKMKAKKQGDLLAEFARHVSSRRFLVVLEDLSTMEEWNAITKFFPSNGDNNGSAIIVSTPNFEVASLSVGHPYRVLHLNQLSAQHSVYAFYKMGWQHEEAKAPRTEDPVPKLKEAASRWLQEHPLIGRDSAIRELGQHLAVAAARSYQVMSVWGIAGVGKSALVGRLFCERICNSRLHKKFAWVELRRPFNLWALSRSMLSSFGSQDLEAMMRRRTAAADEHDAMGSRNPIVECGELLKNHSCLVVIDGLQSTKEWDSMQAELVSGCNPRTVIVVVATEESVAKHCRGPKGPFKYNVKDFQEEVIIGPKLGDAGTTRRKPWYIQKLAQELSPDDVKMLRELVSKCGGLPKVIVGIARLIGRVTVGWINQARSINGNFMQEVENHGELCGLQGLLSWMQSYFRNCSDFLKPCILYLSIFPPDQHIRSRRLVRRWIAEGYSRDGHEESCEERGEEQFGDLHSLSIIQQPSSVGLGGTRMVSCQVNGFFREYIVSRQVEENLVFELDGSCVLTTQRTGRHLVVSSGWDRDVAVFRSIDFSRLRSLTVSGKWEPFFVSESMKLLRVLDLEDASDVRYSDLKKIVRWFPRLKFLSLRGRTEIGKLPGSVGDLRQLQTLDVRHTSIATLPVGIAKLQDLQYIRAGSGRHGVAMPPGVGKLTALRTLGVVDVGSKAILGELRKLTQLRKLGVSGINARNSSKFFSAISQLAHLESLSVRLDKGSEGCLKDIHLNIALRSLKLHGLGDKLPPWSDQLTKLTKIDLEMTEILKQPEEAAAEEDLSEQEKAMTVKERKIARQGVMTFLGKLPELCVLRLRANRFQDGQLDVSVHTNALEVKSYEKLKILDIACSSSSRVTFGSKTMKVLEQLNVDCSSGSRYQFAGLKDLTELREVRLKHANDDTLKEELESQLKEHKRRPVVKKLDQNNF